MFIKRSRKRVGGKIYEYAHLVLSYNSSQGPRHKLEYSLGKIDFIPPEQDKRIAAGLAAILSGQMSLVGASPMVRKLYESMKPMKGGPKPSPTAQTSDEQLNLWRSAPIEESVGSAINQTQPPAAVNALEVVRAELSTPTGANEVEVAQAELPTGAYEVEVVQAELPADEAEVVQAELVQDEIVLVTTEVQVRQPKSVSSKTDELEFENAREAGSVWVGHNIWEMLGLSSILRSQKFSEEEIRLTKILALNRLIEPASEYATPEWVERTALSDILEFDLSRLNYRKLYGQLDRLHEAREPIERDLFAREANLFNLDTSIYLYDLTSTYFEGQCASNSSAKYGYSRDKRSDCRQIVVGLMLNKEGFPIGHETFDGNTSDSTTVEKMLGVLVKRNGGRRGLTLTVDRGMSDQKNLDLIRSVGHHYIVAAKHTERQKWLAEFESSEGWREIMRSPQPTDARYVPTGVKVKLFERGDEIFVLCISEGRVEKDRAIRRKQETRFLADLEKLQKRVNAGDLKTVKKVHESIGRLRERYPRVGRYYEIDFDENAGTLVWRQDDEKKRRAEQVDGGYLLRTSRKDLGDEEIWRTYMLLTRVEAAFRDLKSPLAMRPIHHQLQHRTEAHIFVCVLSYHLLVSIERLLQKGGITYSWESIRKKLTTHQVVSGVLSKGGRTMEIRRDTKTTAEQRQIYGALGIPSQIFPTPKLRLVDS